MSISRKPRRPHQPRVRVTSGEMRLYVDNRLQGALTSYHEQVMGPVLQHVMGAVLPRLPLWKRLWVRLSTWWVTRRHDKAFNRLQAEAQAKIAEKNYTDTEALTESTSTRAPEEEPFGE